MIISEKQILALLKLIELALQDNLNNSREGAIYLIDQIYNQQSDILKDISDVDK